MKFIVSASELLAHLLKVSGAIVSKPVIPILDNFLFNIQSGKLTIYTTDLETSMSTTMPVESSEDICIAIPNKLLLDTIRDLGDLPVTFDINENYRIELRAGKGKYELVGQNGIDFPKPPAIESDKSLAIPSNVLLRCISKTVFAAGNDELRLNLTGVLVEIFENEINFVATDANRLVRICRKDIKPGFEHTFILPKKALNILKSVLSNDVSAVQIDFNKSNAFFTTNNLMLACRLIDERYPDYRAVIPTDNNNVLRIERTDLMESVRRVANFGNKQSFLIRMAITGNELVVSAEDFDLSNSAVENHTCEYDGQDMEIGFNSKFLSEMLANIDNNQISLHLSTPSKSGLLYPAENETDEDILMLVMPITLGN